MWGIKERVSLPEYNTKVILGLFSPVEDQFYPCLHWRERGTTGNVRGGEVFTRDPQNQTNSTVLFYSIAHWVSVVFKECQVLRPWSHLSHENQVSVTQKNDTEGYRLPVHSRDPGENSPAIQGKYFWDGSTGLMKGFWSEDLWYCNP